ncbi:putative 1-aminocyclopropane-1-carboxylate deaminase [Desulfosarcina alkanivorans]|uniref:Putative 1-aminocyclopropane-1-carboxylate deaminase n=1 Tax=Desulfosarcina alkanivorans TaxID=571177 RepID=A0A5K7YQ50_9BACT|nr:D-cysteine desulfhydrase family protein [Desulfosarcina alkanivorans]BBO68434.1 putative 1-aminocyclopropane-1-carboxylate deaminase [Desulfosarcina alkanivorans]
MIQQDAFPPRITLANTPTPLQKMERLSRQAGVEIFFKRDDFTGSELSGNKVRKLEFILADALQRGADTVITCGGAQSNHCRATALAAVRAGLSSLLLLRTDDPANPPAVSGNILLDRLAGSDVVWISPDQYRARDEVFEREARRLRSEGRHPCIIPEGGSTALGAWGYVAGMAELAADLKRLDGDRVKPTTIVCAAGSGGTLAGLALGARLSGEPVRVVGVNVCDDRDYFVNIIDGICREFDRAWQPHSSAGIPPYDIVDGYVGRGYALSRPEELAAIRDLVRLEGVVLDPVYTGKAYFGMMAELAKAPRVFGERIVFIHTGGLFGLFPIADQFTGLL